jgi:RNA polymerase sigma-70 factor (ECF subfamily)
MNAAALEHLAAERARKTLNGAASKPQFSSDAELALIERVCDGEREVFYQLVQPYERAIFLAAQAILQNEADAEDVAQEAVLKALKNLKGFRRESKFSTWLIQITINEARMRLRKDRKHLYESVDAGQESDEGDYIPRDFADWREIPSETLDRNELRAALASAIASLSPKYREVFILRDVQKLNIAETAAALSISEASVKTRLLRARLQLRDALAPGIDGSWSFGKTNWKKVRPW